MSHSPPHSRTPPTTSASPPRRLTRRKATSPPRRTIDYSPSRGTLCSYPSSSSLSSLYFARGRISPVRRSPAHSRCSSRDQDGAALCDEVRAFTAVIPPKINSLSTTPIPAGPIPPPTPPPASSHDDIDDSESSEGSDEEIVFQRGRRRPITTDIDGLTTPQSRRVGRSRVLRRARANINEASPSGSGSVSPPTVPTGVSAPPTPPKDTLPSGLHHPKPLKRSLKSAYFADGTEIPGLKEHLGQEEQNLLDLNEFVWKDEVDHSFVPYIPHTAPPPITGEFLESKEAEEEQVSVGELEGSLEESVEIHEALYGEFAMAHEIGIALGSPPAVERRLEFALDPEHDTSGDDQSVNSTKSVRSEKSEGAVEAHQSEPSPEPLPEPELESESEYESEPEHSIPGAFKGEDEVLAEINGLKKKGKGKGKGRSKNKAKAEEAAITQEETGSGESTKEEDESENESDRYSVLEESLTKPRIDGSGGRKVTPWPTPRMMSYQSSLENVKGETTDSPESVEELAEAMAKKATSEVAAEKEYADIDKSDDTEEEEDEVFYDAEEGGLTSPPMSPTSRSYSHSRHAELEKLPRSPRSPKSPKSPQENKMDLVLVQSASEASASGSNPSSPNAPETPKKLPLPPPGPPALNVIPATPRPLMSPRAELKNQLGNPPPSLLHRKPTGQVRTLKSSQDPTSPTKPSIPVPKRSTSFSMSGTRKTARRPSLSNQPKYMRESKLHPFWRPRYDGPNDSEGTGLSRTISAPHISPYAQELHRTESATSIGKKRVTKPIKGTKFQIEFIGVGTIKEKGGVLKEKLNTGSGAMKRKFSLKRRPTNS